tara:strand:+ start:1457 stop:1843 length:387 start_codon:yes stop_codon:yes gene_type:complete
MRPFLMGTEINSLAPGQSLFLLIIFSALLLFLIIIVIINRKKIEYKSTDGSIFRNQEAYEEYEVIYERIRPLYEDINFKSKNTRIEGLNVSFINLLRTQGFENEKTLIDNKNEFIKLADILLLKDLEK